MKKTRKFPFRLILQIFFLCLVFVLVRGRQAGLTFVNQVSLHSICPFGGVESIYQFFAQGNLVRQVHNSAVVLMFIVIGLSILFGAVFCGWICPLGTVQELFGKIGRKILGKRYNNLIPHRLDRVLRYLRYVFMALVLYATAVAAELVFQGYDPYYALVHMFSSGVAVAAYVILAIVLALSLIMERPFCKYACPYGAFIGLFNLIRIFRIYRTEETCIMCGLCDKSCPMNIKVSEKTAVRNHQCITCMKCTSEMACPQKNTVSLAASKVGVSKDED